MPTTLDDRTVEILARVYDGLELTWVDDETALSCTVGDLCATVIDLRRERDRLRTLLHAVVGCVGFEKLPPALQADVDPVIPLRGESYEEKWLRLGFRAEWSERWPRAYEIRRVGCLPSDNECLVARLRTVQEVDAWIAERVKED